MQNILDFLPTQFVSISIGVLCAVWVAIVVLLTRKS